MRIFEGITNANSPLSSLAKCLALLSAFFIASCGRSPSAKEIKKMDASNFLFTAPTINDALPSKFSDVAPGAKILRIQEDDWRQYEFISSSLLEAATREIDAIDKIWKEKSVPLGSGYAFRGIHVRNSMPNPISIPFSVSDFETLFGAKSGPITFFEYDKAIADAHAIKLGGFIVYALISDGMITTLGLDSSEPIVFPKETAQRLGKFLSENKLMLVHWRSRTLLKSPEDAIKFLGED